MMICLQCGATYPDTSTFCANDGVVLVPQDPANQATTVPGYDAPTMWSMPTPEPVPEPMMTAVPMPAPMPAPPAPKRKGGLIALVLAIVLVAVVAVGAVLLFHKGGSSGSGGSNGLKVTGTAPVYTEDWTKGVTQQWSQQFSNGSHNTTNWGYGYTPWVISQQVWVIGNNTGIDGIDPATGQTMWHYDMSNNGWISCAQTLVGGNVACLWSDYSNSTPTSKVCLIDPTTGTQQCLDLDGAVTPPPGWTVGWGTLVTGDGALFVSGATGDNNSNISWSTALRIDVNPLKVQWAKEFGPGDCGNGDQPYDVSYSGEPADAGDGTGVTGNVFWYRGAFQGDSGVSPFALDIRNGQSIFSSDICPSIAPVSNDTFIVPDDVQDGAITLPGGGQVNFVHVTGGAIAYGSPAASDAGIVDSDTARPSLPVYYVPQPPDAEFGQYTQGTLGVLSGASWNITMQLQQFIVGGGGSHLNAVVSGNTIVVAGGAGQVMAIDYTTGQVQWSVTVPYEDIGYGSTSDQAVFIVGNVVAVSKMGYSTSDQTTLLSLTTGQQISQMPGAALVSSDGSMLGVVNENGGTYSVTRYVPNTESQQTPPSDAPACPAGMTPVTWTKYSDGSVLICSGNGNYQVISSQGLTASQIDWTDGGYTVTFINGDVLTAYLGGSSVTVTKGGTPTQYVADESWTIATGTADFTDTPTGIPSCPSSTYPISLSIWNGGWLVVCGTGPDAPTSLTYSDGGSQGQGSNVSAVGGGYCADSSSGKVCVYQSPAVVSIGNTQHSVDNNYFSGAGGGGAGQGTGSYGVPAPDATAQAQVQYLVNILNSSAATRSSLGPPSVDVQNCQNLPDAIAQIQVVAQNRQDLMTALNSTPVDHIPNGAQLVTQLQAALQASYDADMAYAAWGQQQETNCAVQPPQAVTDTNNNAGAAKDTFCNTWNTQIAPIYNVPGFTTDQI